MSNNASLPLPERGDMRYFAAVCFTAALGGLLFGFDTAVISAAIELIESQFALGSLMKGWIVSSALVGCMLGAAVGGTLSDRLGRKRVMLLSAVLFGLTAVGCAFAPGPNVYTVLPGLTDPVALGKHVLWLARLVGGVGVGMAGMVVPLYLAEISPAQLRGRMIACYQFAITIGIVAAYLSNAGFRALADSAAPTDSISLYHWMIVGETWRAMLGSLLAPAAIFFVLLFFVPESPRWLVKQGDDRAALAILARIAGQSQATAEIADIRDTIAHEQGSWRQLLAPGVRWPLAMAVFLAVSAQLSGVNAIIYYGPKIFTNAGYKFGSALSSQVILGVVNVAFTLLAMWQVDRWGRRPLLLWGTVGVVATLLAIGTLFANAFTGNIALIVLICTYLACFAFSLGPLPWIFMAEVFPTRVRGRAMSMATLALWAANTAVCLSFPSIDEQLGPAAAFWMYAALVAPVLVFALWIMPETKGRSLEELERFFGEVPAPREGQALEGGPET